MEFKALEDFTEKYDNGRLYKKDAPYPAKGFEPTEERIKELTTKQNNYNRPFIKAVTTKKKSSSQTKSKVADKNAKDKE